MDKTFIEQQKNIALYRLEEDKRQDSKERKAILVATEYLSSLLNPENYTEAQREDLRKLALEFGYKEDTNFNKWVSDIPFPEDRNKE